MRKLNQFFVTLGSLMLGLGVCAGAALAQEVGRVISSTPVVQQVPVQRQVCTNEQVVVQGQKSGAGGIMGAIAGGAIGNNVGSGTGRAVATVIGVLGGAAMGDRVEGAPAPQVQNVQNCRMQTVYENRAAVYNVVYEYGGRQYNVQMPNDPGQYVQLQVTPVGGSAAPAQMAPASIPQQLYRPSGAVAPQTVYAAAPQATTYSQPAVVYTQPAVVYQRPYYVSPYIYPAVALAVGAGYRHGYSHRRYWH